MFTPYETVFGHPPDFWVRYRFYDQSEGGRYYLPSQGYRSDFWYKTDDKTGTFFGIYPEFENKNGKVILDTTIPVEQIGTARMWILSQEWRSFHQENIEIGT